MTLIKKIALFIMLMLLNIFSLDLFCGLNTAYAQVAAVKAAGEALNVGGDVKARALENAKEKAVKKATARFIAPTVESGSLYQKIVANYQQYVVGEPKISVKKKIEEKTVYFCEVSVDFGKIESDIQKEISNLQNKQQNIDDSAIFLVRTVDLPQNSALLTKIPVMILADYGMAFSKYGIATYGSDGGGDAYSLMQSAVKGIDSKQDYEAYKAAVYKAIEQNVDITYAIVGEIKIKNILQNVAGYYAEAECMVEAVKPANNGNIMHIGNHSHTYSANGRNLEESVAIAAKKAAVNSAKYLAEITYNYWQLNRNAVTTNK